MSKTIHKYVLDVTDNQEVNTHLFAKPLAIQVQNDKICLWMEVDTERGQVKFPIKCVGTGHSINLTDPWKHFATIQIDVLVFHYYLPY